MDNTKGNMRPVKERMAKTLTAGVLNLCGAEL
jgi:hypothetical protein